MSGIDFLADTNIIIYILEELPAVKHLLKHDLAVSVITEMELLGKKSISSSEIKAIKKLLGDCPVFPFTHEVKEMAISLKQRRNIKLPDAIIAATAIVNGITLVTSDTGFKNIGGLSVAIVDIG